MAAIATFFLEPTRHVRYVLRRYAGHWQFDGTAHPQRQCPLHANRYWYHNAEVGIAEVEEPDERNHGFPLSRADARWPVQCRCGYPFAAFDEWQFRVDRLYRRSDTAEHVSLVEASAGAIWYADWIVRAQPPAAVGPLWVGPDGHCLMVRTPGGDWCVDGPARQDPEVRGWSREGAVPRISATPEVELNGYRAWLRDGWLTEP